MSESLLSLGYHLVSTCLYVQHPLRYVHTEEDAVNFWTIMQRYRPEVTAHKDIAYTNQYNVGIKTKQSNKHQE